MKQAPCCVQEPSGDDSHLDEDGSEHDDDGEGMSEESFTDEDDEAHDEDQRDVSTGHHELWAALILCHSWLLALDDVSRHEVCS